MSDRVVLDVKRLRRLTELAEEQGLSEDEILDNFLFRNAPDVDLIPNYNKDRAIAQAFLDGKREDLIAKEVGHSVVYVKERLNHLAKHFSFIQYFRAQPGAQRKSFNKEHMEEPWKAVPDFKSDRAIIELWQKGKNSREIAEELEINRYYIVNRISALRNRYPELRIR
jgi:hypothetical protein